MPVAESSAVRIPEIVLNLPVVVVQVCKYVDIPLQHISNLTLLAMNRPPRKHTEDLLVKLRARIPGLALRTTFICGFPGVRLLCPECAVASSKTDVAASYKDELVVTGPVE